MKKLVSLIFTSLFFTVAVQTTQAQFEGKIQYSSYEVSSDGDKDKTDDFMIYVTKDRIMLQGSNKYQFMGSIETEGVLVRLDYKDFVFLAGSENAMKISKGDITSMMNMFGNDSGNSGNLEKREINYEATGEKESILGYDVEKFIFRDSEGKDRHSVVWMTKEVDINWGMLAEPWGSSVEAQFASEIPTDLLFKEKYFPLKMENYKNGRLEGVTEVTDLSRTSVAKAMVQIPSGVKVLSFQDYLFQKMSEN